MHSFNWTVGESVRHQYAIDDLVPRDLELLCHDEKLKSAVI